MRMLRVLGAIIEIVKSFCNGVKARMRVDRQLLDEIEVNNSLCQECTMAPTLLNLYTCVVAERCLERVKDVESKGTYLLYKSDKQVFCTSNRNAQDALLYKGEFLDDVVLLAWTRQAASAVNRAYVNVAKTRSDSKYTKDHVHG